MLPESPISGCHFHHIIVFSEAAEFLARAAKFTLHWQQKGILYFDGINEAAWFRRQSFLAATAKFFGSIVFLVAKWNDPLNGNAAKKPLHIFLNKKVKF